MLVGTIRSTETLQVTVEGDSLEAVRAALTAQAPAGFELVSAPVRMRKGSITLDATGTFARRDAVEEIEVDDMPTLQGKVPDGWQLLSVRRL